MDATTRRKLPIRDLSVLSGEGEIAHQDAVFCPIREASVPLGTCAQCTRLAVMERGSVTCHVPPEPAFNPDAAEAAARTPIGEVMQRHLVAVTADVDLETVAQLLANTSAGCAVVVDDRRGVVGILSKTDILRETADGGAPAERAPAELGTGFHVTARGTAVGDVMRRGVYCLPEDARLSHAIGVMASEGVAHLPVVDVTGALSGLVEADDIVAWLACQLGYVLPPRSTRPG